MRDIKDLCYDSLPDGPDKQEAPIKRHRAHEVFLVIVGLAMLAFCAVFIFLPRSRYSELEKRDLAQFPDLATFDGSASDFTAGISSWFSDSEPYRDSFMALSMAIRNALRISLGDDDEAVTYRPSDTGTASVGADADAAPDGNFDNPLANENAKVAEKGIIIVGKGKNVMALMAFGGSQRSTEPYIALCKEYAEAFPNVQIYAMVAPTSAEFYLPKKAADCSSPQRPLLEYIRQHLPSNVKYVDVYAELAAHVDENIFLRTDHHWTPLGGHYAAKALARAAGVPFKDISNYERRVIHDYVGSMYGYSKDISVKNAPEDFVYYMPKGIDYKTTFVTYRLNKDFQVTSQSAPYQGDFFHHFKDGSGAAYTTFMGGDTHLVKVVTGTKNNRKLLITKDSYGNTLPSNLFYSFSEIHVVDFRYFKENMKDYVARNGITDIALFFNIFNVCGNAATDKVHKFLTQPAHDFSLTPQGGGNTSKESKPKEKPKGNSAETPEHKPKATAETPAASVETSGAESPSE